MSRIRSPPRGDFSKFKGMLNDLVGTRGAYILDKSNNVLGKVPISELITSIRGLRDVNSLILDGSIDRDLVSAAERAHIRNLVGTKSEVRSSDSRVNIITPGDF